MHLSFFQALLLLLAVLSIAAWIKHKINGVCPDCSSWMLQFRYNKEKNWREEWRCIDCKHEGRVIRGHYVQ